MGSSALLAVTAGAEIGSTLFSGASKFEGSKQRQAALQQRLQQEEDVARQNQINQMRSTNKIMASQMAAAAANGGSLQGPNSLNTIQMDTLNKFSEDENADALSLSFQKQAIYQQQENEGKGGLLSAGSSLLQAIGQAASMYHPSGGGAVASGSSQAVSAAQSAVENAGGTGSSSIIPEI